MVMSRVDGSRTSPGAPLHRSVAVESSREVNVDRRPATDSQDLDNPSGDAIDDAKAADADASYALQLVDEVVAKARIRRDCVDRGANLPLGIGMKRPNRFAALRGEANLEGGHRLLVGAEDFLVRKVLAFPQVSQASPDLRHEVRIGHDLERRLPAFDLVGADEHRHGFSVPRDDDLLVPARDLVDEPAQRGLGFRQWERLHKPSVDQNSVQQPVSRNGATASATAEHDAGLPARALG